MSFTYKGLKATLTKHIVTGEEVDRQMQRALQANPRIAEITDRPTENGDEVVLDYAGFCEGEQFAGGTAENQTLVLGSGMFIPGFEEQLLDKVCGEKVIVKVTFPTEYHAENLAGKEAEFHCTIHQIRVKTQYELDDTFAKEVGGCETYDEMWEKMRQSMQAYTDDRGEMDLQDRLLKLSAETLDVTIAPEELEKALDQQIQTMEAQLAQQGLNLEMYCSFMNTTREDLRKDAEPSAIAAIKAQAVIDRVVILEGLTVEEAEMESAIEGVCRQNGMTREQLQPYMGPEFEAAIKRSVLTGKVMAIIRDHADVTVV